MGEHLGKCTAHLKTWTIKRNHLVLEATKKSEFIKHEVRLTNGILNLSQTRKQKRSEKKI